MSFAVSRPVRSTSHSRRGLIAISEIMVMVVTLVSLFWIGSQVVAVILDTPAAATISSNSDRAVYRISLIDDQRMWVYRPRTGVLLQNLVTGEVEQSVPLANSEISAVAHSKDGSTTLICRLDGSLLLYRDNGDVRVTQVQDCRDMVVDATVSRDGQVAVCVTSQGKIYGWSGFGSELNDFSYRVSAHRSPVMRTGLNAAGDRLYVASVDGLVTFHSPQTGSPKGEALQVERAWRDNNECTAFAWTDDERLLAVAATSGRVRAYDLQTSRVVCDGTVANSVASTRPTAIAISPDGQRLVVTTNTSIDISVWNLSTGEFTGQLRGHGSIVRTMQFSPSSTSLYSGSYDGTIREWSVESNSQLRIVD